MLLIPEWASNSCTGLVFGVAAVYVGYYIIYLFFDFFKIVFFLSTVWKNIKTQNPVRYWLKLARMCTTYVLSEIKLYK